MKKIILFIIVVLVGVSTVIYKNTSLIGEEMIVSRYGDKISVPHSAVPYVPAIIKTLQSTDDIGSLCILDRTRIKENSCFDSARYEKMGLLKQIGNSNNLDKGISRTGCGPYDMSDVGRAGYMKGSFCFGSLRFKRLVDISPVEQYGGKSYVFVKYTQEIINYNPVVLYSPYLEKEDLTITHIKNINPWLTPAQINNFAPPVFTENSTESLPTVSRLEVGSDNQFSPNNDYSDQSVEPNKRWVSEYMKMETLREDEFRKRIMSRK